MSSSSKLNVGSGFPKPPNTEAGWLNIDNAKEGLIDITGKGFGCEFQRMSVLEMPDEWTNKFEVVHCIHMLEHLNRNFRQKVVQELHRVLAPGGKLYLEVPDFQTIISKLHSAFESGDAEAIHIWTTSIYGKQRYEGDAHHWGFSNNHLHDLVKKAGFSAASTWFNCDTEQMVSPHYLLEPIILIEATK